MGTHTGWGYRTIRWYPADRERINEKKLLDVLKELGIIEVVWTDFTPLAARGYIYIRAFFSDQQVAAFHPGGEEVF